MKKGKIEDFEKTKKEFKVIMILFMIYIIFDIATSYLFSATTSYSLIVYIFAGLVSSILISFFGIYLTKKGSILSGIFGLLVGIYFITGGAIDIILGIIMIIASAKYLYSCSNHK